MNLKLLKKQSNTKNKFIINRLSLRDKDINIKKQLIKKKAKKMMIYNYNYKNFRNILSLEKERTFIIKTIKVTIK